MIKIKCKNLHKYSLIETHRTIIKNPHGQFEGYGYANIWLKNIEKNIVFNIETLEKYDSNNPKHAGDTGYFMELSKVDLRYLKLIGIEVIKWVKYMTKLN